MGNVPNSGSSPAVNVSFAHLQNFFDNKACEASVEAISNNALVQIAKKYAQKYVSQEYKNTL